MHRQQPSVPDLSTPDLGGTRAELETGPDGALFNILAFEITSNSGYVPKPTVHFEETWVRAIASLLELITSIPLRFVLTQTEFTSLEAQFRLGR